MNWIRRLVYQPFDIASPILVDINNHILTDATIHVLVDVNIQVFVDVSMHIFVGDDNLTFANSNNIHSFEDNLSFSIFIVTINIIDSFLHDVDIRSSIGHSLKRQLQCQNMIQI